MNLASFLKRRPSISDMRAALERMQHEQAATAQMRDRLIDEREHVYLEGSDAEIAKHQAAIRTADETLDRLDIQTAGLARRIAEAERAEKVAALDALAADAQRASDEGVKLVDEYQRAARAMAKTLAALRATEEKVAAANAAALAAIEAGLIDARPLIATPTDRTVERSAEPGAGTPAGPIYDRVELPDARWIGRKIIDGRRHIWSTGEDMMWGEGAGQ